MIYDIKAIPTTYAGVNFRSRLEARWAAFFDICGWKWDYEPFDLDGWAPDFLIKTRLADVLVEVKPLRIERVIDHPDILEYEKACRHQNTHQVLLLGMCPVEFSLVPGSLLEPPDGAPYVWGDIAVELRPSQIDWTTGEYIEPDYPWREAGNRVQWAVDEKQQQHQSALEIVRRASRKAA